MVFSFRKTDVKVCNSKKMLTHKRKGKGLKADTVKSGPKGTFLIHIQGCQQAQFTPLVCQAKPQALSRHVFFFTRLSAVVPLKDLIQQFLQQETKILWMKCSWQNDCYRSLQMLNTFSSKDSNSHVHKTTPGSSSSFSWHQSHIRHNSSVGGAALCGHPSLFHFCWIATLRWSANWHWRAFCFMRNPSLALKTMSLFTVCLLHNEPRAVGKRVTKLSAIIINHKKWRNNYTPQVENAFRG